MSNLEIKNVDCIWEKEYINHICTNIHSENCGKKCTLNVQNKCDYYEIEREDSEEG